MTKAAKRSSESSQLELQLRAKGSPMKMIRISRENIKPLTKAEIARLKVLAARPDSEIHTSDIPEWTEAQFKSAKRGLFYRPVKRQITARVDADVLEWL